MTNVYFFFKNYILCLIINSKATTQLKTWHFDIFLYICILQLILMFTNIAEISKTKKGISTLKKFSIFDEFIQVSAFIVQWYQISYILSCNPRICLYQHFKQYTVSIHFWSTSLQCCLRCLISQWNSFLIIKIIIDNIRNFISA